MRIVNATYANYDGALAYNIQLLIAAEQTAALNAIASVCGARRQIDVPDVAFIVIETYERLTDIGER